MVTDEWAENYKFEAYITIPPPAQNMDDDENFGFLVGDPLLTRNASSSAFIDNSIRSRQKRKFEEVADVFENLVSGSSQKKSISQYDTDIYEDDLSKYLAEPVRVRNRGKQNITMTYWKYSESMYPNLAKMARKFLSPPASSYSCERLFSTCKHFLTPTRPQLTAESLKESVLVVIEAIYLIYDSIHTS
ncbi:hypothetical protein INT47_009586 [Mucor saturninus]|uniref:HAT C-terminal dimerisation domain-containing protein n=1 Tax=Mucor saturninus TaxID=64648 RepID=A0A8H7US43_9FUNG|nr:hypothetical protein INT47_009586 [Mucor saturninus]